MTLVDVLGTCTLGLNSGAVLGSLSVVPTVEVSNNSRCEIGYCCIPVVTRLVAGDATFALTF